MVLDLDIDGGRVGGTMPEDANVGGDINLPANQDLVSLRKDDECASGATREEGEGGPENVGGFGPRS